MCLGGGVAGEALANGLRGSGLTIAVVERELVGGECPYWGCIPSKTLLRWGETLAEADRARWMARNLDDTRPAAALEATGARLVRGDGRLIDRRTIEVGSEHLVARRAVVIANGSTAVIPPIPGLSAVEYWTNRQATLPQELPASLVASEFGVEDLVGNGWEWTASVFGPFAGFTPSPSYPEYSAAFFDGAHYIMKGASPLTAAPLVRRGFRNWFRPRYPFVYATFRCVDVTGAGR